MICHCLRPRALTLVLVLACLTALSVLAGCSHPQWPSKVYIPPEPPSGYTPKTTAYAQHDMVATAHPLATEAGLAMLARGGSAVDAAIAAQLVLTLVEPQSSGIGGGAFLMHHDRARRQTLAYDGRETAPQQATPDLFADAHGQPLSFLDAVDSGLSVGTPGVLRVLAMAHRAHGKLPWSTLFEPAIQLSEAGFAVSPRLSLSIAASATRIQAQGGAVADYFLQADGTAKPAGTWLRNPELAVTLRTLATEGVEAFYQGAIAQDIVAKVRRHPTRPGHLAMSDLANYTAKVRTPVCSIYRVTYRVCGMPAPSSGGLAVLQTLGILAHFDLGVLPPLSTDAVHLVSEAYRLAYADRARYIADPDFVPVPQLGLIDPAYLQQRAQRISMQRSMGVPEAGTPPGGSPVSQGDDTSPSLPSTSHLSIVDRAGNAVSMTSSIENSFGSLQFVRGFLLNNQLTDFSFKPTDAAGRPIANRVQPGKRPRSSMAPTLVFNARTGDLEATLGSPGGSAIIQYTVKSLLGLMDWQLDIQQAIDLPNFGAQTDAATWLEKGSAMDTPIVREGLVSRGHRLRTDALTSGLQGVVFNGRRADGTPGLLSRNPGAGTYAGGADPRREGVALGR